MGIVNDGRGNKCPICGHPNIDIYCSDAANWYESYSCPECGEFFGKRFWRYDDRSVEDELFCDQLKSYLFYHKTELRPFICDDAEYASLDVSKFTKIYHLSPNIVQAWYPRSFADKIDLILLKLDGLAEYDGAYIKVHEYADRLYFCKNVGCENVSTGCDKAVQIQYVEDFLKSNLYVKDLGNSTIQLMPKALERIYQLKKEQSSNKNVFVSMAFNSGTAQTREAIRKAIVDSGYSPEFIDEIIHNKQIVPEMFRLIRECRFLILDISDPNYGAYYEAGYALGLGKEVIICCSQEMFSKEYKRKEEKKYARYLRPHFDIAQKQILVWKDYSDLTKKLCEWIKFLF